jgi:hypothetical protein
MLLPSIRKTLFASNNLIIFFLRTSSSDDERLRSLSEAPGWLFVFLLQDCLGFLIASCEDALRDFLPEAMGG